MDDSLIDDDRLGLARKSVLPGTGFFVPDSVEAAVAEREAAATLDGAETVVVADPDADGLGCVALIREAVGDAGLLPAGPHEIEDVVGYLVDYADPGVTVYVCDLSVDESDELGPLEVVVDRADAVHWFDHHQWDETVAEAVRDLGVDLTVGDSDEECSTDVALRSLGADLPARFTALAAVTRDHDLWIRDDPRSDDLADFAYWGEPERYVATVREHGPDLPADIEAELAERRVEKEALIDRAVDRADVHEVGPWTVGVTYGRCSQNEVAERLRGAGCDAAIVVKPAGSASIRGSEGFERCHEVAGRVNGGGHPRAAGCKPAIYEDMLDYAHHWTTRGAVAKRTILDAFQAVAAETD